ncbi:MAG: ribosome recycling factor [Myxococcales bacterium]|jgi:ribosome recycling factor|nr:MAG: ribosome recycling factor [Myxococcales bacterium]
MIDQVLGQLEADMKANAASLTRDFSRIRTGRANPSLLDSIHVDYYGADTPLNQLATVSAPEPKLIVVQPFDQSVINGIEKAIRSSDLGLSPVSDGKILRVPLPDLTEERRRDLVKQVRKDAERHRVSARIHRREANDMLKELLNDKEIAEDDQHRAQDKVEELTRAAIARIDEITKGKEAEVMSV